MPLIKSSSPQAFKHNLKAELKAGKPMKQSLAIAYSQKRGNKKAKGGKVTQTCPNCAKGMCMAHGGMAEGGKVNAMKPLEQDPANSNLELNEQIAPSDSSHIDPGISSEEDSDLQEDLPRVSEALSLAADILADRKRRKMALGGKVNHQEDMKLSGDGPAMAVGSLEDGIDEPTLSHLSNNDDEGDVDPEDGRESRGMNIATPHIMDYDSHDQEDASKDSDYEENDDSLVGQILKERKMRRRG